MPTISNIVRIGWCLLWQSCTSNMSATKCLIYWCLKSFARLDALYIPRAPERSICPVTSVSKISSSVTLSVKSGSDWCIVLFQNWVRWIQTSFRIIGMFCWSIIWLSAQIQTHVGIFGDSHVPQISLQLPVICSNVPWSTNEDKNSRCVFDEIVLGVLIFSSVYFN